MSEWPRKCPFCGGSKIAVIGGETVVGAKCIDCNVVIQGSTRVWEEE